MIGAGALGGIGFTVSLFVTELAFGEEIVGTDARLGVLVGSLVARHSSAARSAARASVTNDHSMDEALGMPADDDAPGPRTTERRHIDCRTWAKFD